jgi:hypothetical protein
LASSGTVGAAWRTRKVCASAGALERLALRADADRDPDPLGGEREVLVDARRGPGAPVMQEMSRGAVSRLPRNSTPVSTAAKSSSGSAQCSKYQSSKKRASSCIRCSSASRRCSALRSRSIGAWSGGSIAAAVLLLTGRAMAFGSF